jgi:hypothetical protein
MKQCPACLQNYDDAENFCQSDGSTLIVISMEQTSYSSADTPTVVIPKFPNGQTNPLPVKQTSPILYALIGGMAVLILVLGGFLLYRQSTSESEKGKTETIKKSEDTTKDSNKNEKVTTNESETIPAPTVKTIIVEKEVPKIAQVPLPSVKQVDDRIVTVNSPRDGYLALKTEPCIAPCGTMLLKIPHGTKLTLGTCKNNFEVADRRRGRWCYTSYGGNTGWIFDAFVTR